MGLEVGVPLLFLGVALLFVADAQGQCFTPDRQRGNCINVRQCAPLVSRLTSPNRQQSDIQYLRDSQCGFDGLTPKVCCPGDRTPNNSGQQGGDFPQPGGNSGQHGGNSGQQGGNFGQQPGNFGQQPGNFGQQPGNFGQQPGNFGQQPGNFGQQPGNFGQQPGNFGQQPGNFGQQPGNFGQQGGNFGQQPGNFGQQGQIGIRDLLPSDCGRDAQNRIFGGNITDIDEYPWMALLEYRTRNGKATLCGGSLISKRYVLTAAHCLKSKDQESGSTKLESVRLGEYNTATERDCLPDGDEGERCSPPPVTIRVEEQIVHEDYASQSKDQRYDIALLRLAEDAKFTDYVRPICLPKTSNLKSQLTVAGWGRTETRRASDVKLKVKLPLADMGQCSRLYQQNSVTLGEGQLCAGGQAGFDSCAGDSGGPLMQQGEPSPPDYISRWTVVGVVSFGPKDCGTPGFPGIYSTVYDYMPWIMGKLRA